MYLLSGNHWKSGYVEYERYLPQHIKIRVANWYLLEAITNQYISYPKDLRIIWNYLKDVGLRALYLKLRSRLKEGERNLKYSAFGLGRVIEVDDEADYKEGDKVAFFASNHPKCVNLIVVEKAMALKVSGSLRGDESVHFFKDLNLRMPGSLKKYVGYSHFSDEIIEENELKEALTHLYKQTTEINNSVKYSVLKTEEQFLEPSKKSCLSGCYKAILYGLGNYAKVFIIPNLNPKISLCKISEIDPAQIGTDSWKGAALTTAPTFKDEKFDVYFAAGYHHTHASVAVEALKNNACAVIEKPIATTHKQLKSISDALEVSSGKFFACFHKRYSKLNSFVFEDFANEASEAIHYHCIVYEIPLPSGHWYNWKTSGSRIVSNGCHWIDHFMFLNSYSPAVTYSVKQCSAGQIAVLIELKNGALFSMLLTDVGSNRLGVRDYIELRKGKTTIYMTDSSIYASENDKGWIRKTKINKIDAYKNMYSIISNKITEGIRGDDPISLRSSQLVLDLENLLQKDSKLLD